MFAVFKKPRKQRPDARTTDYFTTDESIEKVRDFYLNYCEKVKNAKKALKEIRKQERKRKKEAKWAIDHGYQPIGRSETTQKEEEKLISLSKKDPVTETCSKLHIGSLALELIFKHLKLKEEYKITYNMAPITTQRKNLL